MQRLKIRLRIERCHASRARTGDRLAIHVISHVARGENAGNARRSGATIGAGFHLDEATLHFELALENTAVGRVSNRHEEARRFNFLRAAVDHALEACAGYT